MCDLKATQKNVQHSLIQELRLYNNATEAAWKPLLYKKWRYIWSQNSNKIVQEISLRL